MAGRNKRLGQTAKPSFARDCAKREYQPEYLGKPKSELVCFLCGAQGHEEAPTIEFSGGIKRCLNCNRELD